VAGATQASDRFAGLKCIEEVGKCALDGSGKYPLNKNDEEICEGPSHYGTAQLSSFRGARQREPGIHNHHP
jgi:hypothetical protein